MQGYLSGPIYPRPLTLETPDLSQTLGYFYDVVFHGGELWSFHNIYLNQGIHAARHNIETGDIEESIDLTGGVAAMSPRTAAMDDSHFYIATANSGGTSLYKYSHAGSLVGSYNYTSHTHTNPEWTLHSNEKIYFSARRPFEGHDTVHFMNVSGGNEGRTELKALVHKSFAVTGSRIYFDLLVFDLTGAYIEEFSGVNTPFWGNHDDRDEFFSVQPVNQNFRIYNQLETLIDDRQQLEYEGSELDFKPTATERWRLWSSDAHVFGWPRLSATVVYVWDR